MLTTELEKCLAELSFHVVSYYWEVRDRKDSETVGPKHWPKEQDKYWRWVGDEKDTESRVRVLLDKITCLSKLASNAGEQLVRSCG
jgi:hypothetical protein